MLKGQPVLDGLSVSSVKTTIDKNTRGEGGIIGILAQDVPPSFQVRTHLRTKKDIFHANFQTSPAMMQLMAFYIDHLIGETCEIRFLAHFA